MVFENLRDKYLNFIYDSYSFNVVEDFLNIEYKFKIVDLEDFEPTLSIPLKGNSIDLKNPALEKLVFSLGLVEMISYWKLTCSKQVEIKAGFLNQEQGNWWKKLYFNGLGEFFYTNGINTNIEEFMDITCTGSEIKDESVPLELKGTLIPLGGGKDSIVSMDLLKNFYEDNDCFIINERDATVESAKLYNYYPDKTISIKRSLDKRMFNLNSIGFLNGHTPFSAIVAFTSFLVAYIYKKEYIALSNEASANESTVLNTEVNHQYSKSFEFEVDFTSYVNKYLNYGIKYFSLLRSLSEFQIAYHFSKLTNAHKIFKSCNSGSKSDIWCCNCSKCLFVFIMLTAFLDLDYVSDIFGKNILEDKELLETLYKLTGVLEEKPFECVGSRDEVNVAICIAIDKMDNPPLLYKEYMKTELYKTYKDKPNTYFNHYDENTLVPTIFNDIIKNIFDIG